MFAMKVSDVSLSERNATVNSLKLSADYFAKRLICYKGIRRTNKEVAAAPQSTRTSPVEQFYSKLLLFIVIFINFNSKTNIIINSA